MAETVSTNALMNRIFKSNDLDTFIVKNGDHLWVEDFCSMVKTLCEERRLVPERVILQSQIDRTYGHQLFNGTRNPSRDKVLQLAFGMELNVDETQKLLRAANRSTLYPRLKRDAVILFCLNKGYSIADVQEELIGHGMTPLGGIPRDDT